MGQPTETYGPSHMENRRTPGGPARGREQREIPTHWVSHRGPGVPTTDLLTVSPSQESTLRTQPKPRYSHVWSKDGTRRASRGAVEDVRTSVIVSSWTALLIYSIIPFTEPRQSTSTVCLTTGVVADMVFSSTKRVVEVRYYNTGSKILYRLHSHLRILTTIFFA